VPGREEGVELIARAVGPWGTNAYALVCRVRRESLLIDPGGEPDTLLAMVQGSEPVGILVTHSHVDHISALLDVREALKVPVMAHRGARGIEADHWLVDGDLVELGEHALRVYHTPGHTEDSICYYLQGQNLAIVGDAIFEGGPGHTSSPQAFQITLRTLREVVLTLPDETMCNPGHGPCFRLGDKRAAIEEFLSKEHGSFFGDATWEM